MARQVKVQIELEGGKELKQYTSLRIDQHLSAHHSFEIGVPFGVLESSSEHFFHHAHQDVCGKTITISFSPVSQQDTFDFTFKGIVTEITLSTTFDLASSFRLKGYSTTILLEDSAIRRTFLNQSLQQIAEAVLDPYPNNLLRRQLDPRSSATLRYSVQYDETNFAFLNRLAAEQGEWFFYDGRELRLGPPATDPAVEFAVDGIQTFAFAIGLQPASLTLAAYDYRQPTQYSSQSASQSVSGLGQFGNFALQKSEEVFSQPGQQLAGRPVYSQQELDDRLKTRKAVHASTLMTFRGSGEVPALLIGRAIDVQGLVLKRDSRSKESFGKYRITGISHEVDGSGNYQNQFKAIPEQMAYPPPNPSVTRSVAQPELAQVIDNKDPDKLGRIKVEFLWPGNQAKESDWLRVGVPYAGAGEGMLFVPECDAQVLIGYVGNHPEDPFVMSSFYPKKTGVDYTSGGNNRKVIQTRSGHQLLFVDEAGKEKIQFTNVNHTDTTLTLEFGGNGRIYLKTPGDLQLEGGTISLKAEKNLTLEAGQELHLKAQTKATVKAGMGLEMGAPDIKLNADATAEFQAKATLNLKSAMTSLKGDALVEVQATLIKLN